MGNSLTQRVLSNYEVIIEILKLLDFKDQMKMSRVHLGFQKILLEHVWSHELALDTYELDYDLDLPAKSTEFKLHKLIVNGGRNFVYGNSFDKLMGFSNLSELTLKDVTLDLTDISYILNYFRNLNRFDIKHVSITNMHGQEVRFNFVLESLKCLYLRYHSGLKDLIEKCCPNLQELTLYSISEQDLLQLNHALLPSEEIEQRIKQIRRKYQNSKINFQIYCKTQQPLELNICTLVVSGTVGLQKIINNEYASKLASLNINIFKDAVQLSSLHQLKYLLVHECFITDFTNLLTLQNLISLKIYTCQLDRVNVWMLLKNLKQLQTLYLIESDIPLNTEPAAIAEESEAMQSSSVTTLQTSWQGLQHFIEQQPNAFGNLKTLKLDKLLSVNQLVKLIIKNCHSLRKLEFYFCHIDLDESTLLQLGQMSTLVELSLCNFTLSKSFHLEHLLKSENLKSLQVDYCSPTACRIERFKVNNIVLPDSIKCVVSINDTCFIDNITFWTLVFDVCSQFKLFIYGDMYYIIKEIAADLQILNEIESIQFVGQMGMVF